MAQYINGEYNVTYLSSSRSRQRMQRLPGLLGSKHQKYNLRQTLKRKRGEMFTSNQIKNAWFILNKKGEVDHQGWENINKVLDFLDEKFDEVYEVPKTKKEDQ